MKRPVLVGIVLALAIAACAAPFASSSPDGLERVAEDLGFAGAAASVWTRAPLPDYQMPGIAGAGLSTALAGVLGTSIVLGAGLLLGRVLRS